MTAMLHSLTRQPPEIAVRTLRLLRSRLMDPSGSLNAAQRASVFTEAALAQLASLAAQIVPQGSNRWGDAPRRALVETAHDILVAVGSSPVHGMCTEEPEGGMRKHGEGSWGSLMAAVQVEGDGGDVRAVDREEAGVSSQLRGGA